MRCVFVFTISLLMLIASLSSAQEPAKINKYPLKLIETPQSEVWRSLGVYYLSGKQAVVLGENQTNDKIECMAMLLSGKTSGRQVLHEDPNMHQVFNIDSVVLDDRVVVFIAYFFRKQTEENEYDGGGHVYLLGVMGADGEVIREFREIYRDTIDKIKYSRYAHIKAAKGSGTIGVVYTSSRLKWSNWSLLGSDVFFQEFDLSGNEISDRQKIKMAASKRFNIVMSMRYANRSWYAGIRTEVGPDQDYSKAKLDSEHYVVRVLDQAATAPAGKRIKVRRIVSFKHLESSRMPFVLTVPAAEPRGDIDSDLYLFYNKRTAIADDQVKHLLYDYEHYLQELKPTGAKKGAPVLIKGFEPFRPQKEWHDTLEHMATTHEWYSEQLETADDSVRLAQVIYYYAESSEDGTTPANQAEQQLTEYELDVANATATVLSQRRMTKEYRTGWGIFDFVYKNRPGVIHLFSHTNSVNQNDCFISLFKK